MEKQKSSPELRFVSFNGEYKQYKLSELLSRHSEHNKDEEFSIDDILSLSSIHGIVDRKELLEDTYSNVNHKNYIKTRYNDFVYGKSISSSYPYGLFKVNDCRDGLLSTLYFTFKVGINVMPSYLDRYFSHHNRANNFLKQFVLVGDRYITADANFILSGKINIPTLPEQQKIATFFTAIDDKLQALKKKKTLLEEYKKGMMQQLFSQQLRFKDENGNDFPDWEEKKLGDVAIFLDEKRIPISEILRQNMKGIYPYYGASGVIDYINQYIFDGEYILLGEDGANILNRSTPLAFVVSGKFWVNNHAHIMQAKGNNRFLAEFLERINYEPYNTGTVQPKLNATICKSIPIEIPCIEEQTKIANFLSSIDKKIAHTSQQIEQTETWKKGLLQKMFC